MDEDEALEENTEENHQVEIEDVDDEDDENQISPPELVQLMEEAWLNEKFSPEILPHKTEMVEILLGQIAYIEENLKKLKTTDFKKTLYQMESDRLKFVITSYLRYRIEKIETYSTYILEQEKQRSEKQEEMYLSQNELTFAQEYEQSLRQHFDSVMSFCPEMTPTAAIEPNMHSMVFLKSKGDVEGVVINDRTDDDSEYIDLTSGSQVLVNYSSVANLVKNGGVHLI